MPNGDGTGPMWSSGNWRCNGRKGGFMPRCWAGRTMTKDEEKQMLSARLETIKAQMEGISKRLSEI